MLTPGRSSDRCSASPLGEDFVRRLLQTLTCRLLSVKKRFAYSFPSLRLKDRFDPYIVSITHSPDFVKRSVGNDPPRQTGNSHKPLDNGCFLY